MMRRSTVIAVLVAIGSAVGATDSSAQLEHAGEIEGIVRDIESGTPLAGATVSVIGTGRTAVTHGDGSFHIPVPTAPGYGLRVERLGYATRTIELDAPPDEAVTLEMEVAALTLPGFVVTGAVTERATNETLRPTSTFAAEELQRRLATTVAQTLASEPGLAVVSMGPSSAHPVIRGLSGDRILMLEDGQRIGDVFNSGVDHATAVDPSSARRIEVIRGPAAILLGSNALGGVINVIRDEVPPAVPHHPTGSASLHVQTVTSALGGSAETTVAVTEHIPLRVELSKWASGDLKTPVGTLAGTQTDTWNASVGSSWVDDWGHAGGAFRYYRNDYGIPGGFTGGHIAGVRVEMERAAARLRSVIRPRRHFEGIEVDAGYTWYEHSEIEPPNILGTAFRRQTVSGGTLARHSEWGPFSSGAVGARASSESFAFGGALYTPDTRRTTAAAYLLEEIDLDPVRIEAGLRYDRVEVQPLREDPDSEIGHIRARSFGAASGSLGALAQLTGQLTVGASLARAFRTPDVNELYSEGPHLAAYAFEVGNPSLDTEQGTGIDVFARLSGERINAEVTWFRNSINGYVFPLETGELSRVRLPIYQFEGENALLTGFEGVVRWLALDAVEFEAVASHVVGNIRSTDEPLPLMPPLQGRLSIGYAPVDWFAEAEVRMAARQGRTGAFETPTDQYAIFGLSGGVRLTLDGRLHVVTLHLNNLGNTEYRNHLSRVKDIMPEAGRSASFAYRVVF